ncbi:Phosphoribosyl pyrophosphate (PRPP) synthase 3 isoform 3 [Carex littledalei]|uniref:Phosphoribosyl pyrophosphate (PRPP) synthase 3 isoform 3 n=1 Tax=Carex littledalei TaxID=544730 RepID=A0A833QMB2_9POAL|nr:Phosphoribosyl pyrophosphate (PRPP) synthase 3 isoform 3 [Carex littledalei]
MNYLVELLVELGVRFWYHRERRDCKFTLKLDRRGDCKLVPRATWSKERFYFGDNVLPCFGSAVPLLKNRLQELPDSDNISIAFPDDGAWKRFHKQLQHFPVLTLSVVPGPATLSDSLKQLRHNSQARDWKRAKMLAKVPDEMKSYVQTRVRVGNLICLKDFKVEPAYQKHITFDKCKILDRDFQIVFDKDTTILPLPQSICNFPLYPMVSSIETIYGIQRGNHLIDVVGRVCYGHKVEYLNRDGGYRVPALEIYLLDWTCNVIALVLIGLPLTNHVRIVRACHDKSIIFVTRVKVILHTPLNYLQATDISSVTFDPMMPEVLALRHSFIG